jgi:hypothetical protein
MSHSAHLPLSSVFIKCITNQKKKLFEPPIHTDAHRIKADKEKGLFKKYIFFFIKSLSVFIGVHRWLKTSVFDLLNPDLSVCSVCGSL